MAIALSGGYGAGAASPAKPKSGSDRPQRRVLRGEILAPGDDDEDGLSITKLRRQYSDFSQSKINEIEEARLARHYYHNDQLTPNEVRVLKARRQPAVIRNMIDRKINAVVGLLERLRQDPKAYPRNPNEEKREGDQLATAVVRYVLDKPDEDGSDWASTAAECARQGGIEGIYGIEMLLEAGDTSTDEEKGEAYPWWEQKTDPDVSYRKVDGDTFFYDPRSTRPTFSDARYMGCGKWVDLDIATDMFPDFADELEGMMDDGGGFMNLQQQDREMRWIDTDEEKVFLVEHWYIRNGEWNFCYYVGFTILHKGISPFRDEKNKTFCRFIMGSVNVDHDGDRYGFIRGLKSRQDEINARGSKALHLLNARRIIAEKGAVVSIEAARLEAVRPDGYLEVAPGKRFEFDDAKNAQEFAGHLELFQEVKTEIENFGPNPALIGEGIENKSGRAIALLQQAGIAELGPFILGYRGWKLRVYRAIWNTVQRHWKSERWIRVTDADDKAQFLQLNAQVLDEFGRPQMVNDIGQLDVDILLDEGPDTMTMMQDVYDTMVTMAQNGAAIPPEVLIELAPIPGRTKKAIIDKMTEAMAKQNPPEAQQLQMAGAVAGVKKTAAEAERASADAEVKRATLPGNVVKLHADSTKSRAGALRDIASSVTDIHRAGHEARAMNADLFNQEDQGIGQFQPGPYGAGTEAA